jgi:hypothetical protein
VKRQVITTEYELQRQLQAKALYSYASSLIYKMSTENVHITSGVRSQYYGTAVLSTILLLLIIYFMSHTFRNVPANTFYAVHITSVNIMFHILPEILILHCLSLISFSFQLLLSIL